MSERVGGAAVTPTGAKARDYWWTVFFTDPIALPMVRFLARRRSLSPNQVSVISLILGLSVGVWFSMGTRTSLLIGGVVFYLAFVFDCVDGKLARALDERSPLGAGLDRISDGARRGSAALGLLWALARLPSGVVTAGGPAPLMLDEFLDRGALYLMIVYVVLAYYFLEVSGAQRDDAPTGARGRWSAALARRRLLPTPGMPDVQAVVFILGPITGLIEPALILGIVMVAAGIAISVARRMRAAPS
ncbi:MAG TPA: CDP-alcohol phosphatidyltransferase family protein [Actinomycetota bacterium]|nr:CDP-alcohol phosphatidyltransferase family protein [Actinomycetota bacterium]